MLKIGIFLNQSRTSLIIETETPLLFELRNSDDKLLVTGNKLTEPSVSINIKRLNKGTYHLVIHVQGETVYKTVAL